MPGESQLPPVSAPDPSVYAQAAIDRAVESLRVAVESEFRIRDERFDGIDKATEVLSETINRTPTEIQREVGHLKELMTQAIAGRDALVALQTECSDKATGKAEAAFTKQIDALATLVDKSIDALSDRINDNKTKIDRIEAQKLGGAEQRTGSMALIASVTGVIIFVVIVAGFVIALATKSPA